MLKLCGDAICRPLDMIFDEVLIFASLLSDRKKANIIPIPIKGEIP